MRFCFFCWYSYWITSSAVNLKICVTSAGTKRYKSIIKKKKRKHDKIVLLAISKLNSIEVLITNPSDNKTSWQRCNDFSVERRQDVSVVRLHDNLLERCGDVSRGHNNNILSVCLHNLSNKSQMKHPTKS